MGGGAKKSLKMFIEDIPDSALEALPTNPGKIYYDIDFRLDMQGVSNFDKSQVHPHLTSVDDKLPSIQPPGPGQ